MDHPDEERSAAVDGLDQLIRFVVRNTAGLSGMSIPALSTLTTLAESGSLRITDLATLEGVSQPSMTTMVNRLERLGLVERQVDPSDGRGALVAITETGQAMRRRRRAGRSAFLATLVERLEPEDVERLDRLAPVLHRLTDREALPEALAAAHRAGGPEPDRARPPTSQTTPDPSEQHPTAVEQRRTASP